MSKYLNFDYGISNKILILKNVENEGPGLITLFFDQNNIDYDVFEYYLTENEIDLNLYSGVIILGGPMSVNDDLSFIYKEIKLIQRIIKKDIPFLGICLGSQLLSKSGGGFITKNKIKEIGVYNVFLTSKGTQNPLFENISNPSTVFQWHSETFTIPPMGEWLATSETCINQALRFGNAYGLQFHIEFTPSMVEELVNQYIDDFVEDQTL
ncbi:MAG: type 1 glutamine amidotransferase, partial [Candidatus Helarchaeota archaeon]